MWGGPESPSGPPFLSGGRYETGYVYLRLAALAPGAGLFRRPAAGLRLYRALGRPAHAFAPDLKRGGLREVLALEEKYQMPVAVYTPEHNAYPYNYMLGDRQQWEDCMAYLELCLEMGKALGAEYTLISVGHGGYGASRQALWNRLLESLRRLADAAERLGHKIVLESLTCYESNLCTSAGELAQALDEVGSPALLGMCDVVPPAAAGEPVENYLDLLAIGWPICTWWIPTGEATPTCCPGTAPCSCPSC